MQPATDVKTRIESIVGSDRVVLFMKGTREAPRCGFSAATVSVLDNLVPGYATFDVLGDQEVREGIKEYSSWPTIPQLYVDGEFVGGCDIVKEMFSSGELHELLGLPAPDRMPPDIVVSDAAAEMIREALAGQPGMSVHLQIDGRWQHGLGLAPASGHEVRAASNGVEILMDAVTAGRARGLSLDVEEGVAGTVLKIDNPNAS